MHAGTISFSRRSWMTALALSLLAHALLAKCFLWSNLGMLTASGNAWSEPLDTRVQLSVEPIALTLWEAPQKVLQIPKPPPLPPAKAISEPHIAEFLPRPPSKTLVSREGWSKGPGEEQKSPGPRRLPQRQVGGSSEYVLPVATTVFFEIPTRAQRLVFVIDRSASMGMDGLLDAAKRELLASLEQLPATARFQVIIYNRQAEVLRIGGSSESRQPSAENLNSVRQALSTIEAEGGTDHIAAIERALLMQPEVIYFLTDAAELRADQIQAIRVRNAGRVVIHTVELRADPRTTQGTSLESLAKANNGCHRLVNPSSFILHPSSFP